MDICRREKIEKHRSTRLMAKLEIQHTKVFEGECLESALTCDDLIKEQKNVIRRCTKELKELSQDITGWWIDTKTDQWLKDKKVSGEPAFRSAGLYNTLEDYEDALIKKAEWHIENGGPMNNNHKYDACVISIDRIHDDRSREALSTLTIGDMWDDPNWGGENA